MVVLLFSIALPAADIDPRQETVATVNGEGISLRRLEDELLKKEGAEAVQELVAKQLDAVEWETVKDDDTLLAMPGWRLPRLPVAAVLLDRKGGEVREDLINLILVQQALAQADLRIDSALLDKERETMERRFYDRLERENQPWVRFDNYIQEVRGMSLEEWVQQPGFRVLAGVHALLYQTYQIPENELRSYFRANKDAYGVSEAVSVWVLFMPFQTNPQQEVTSASRQATISLATNFYRSMQSKKMTWEKVYRLLGGRDEKLGYKGWVDRQGRAETLGEADVPAAVIEQAFRHRPRGDQPELLEPILHRSGVTIMQVADYRPGQVADFDQLRDQIQRDYIDADLEKWSTRFMNQLRRDAKIDYASMPGLVEARRQQARVLLEQTATESQ